MLPRTKIPDWRVQVWCLFFFFKSGVLLVKWSITSCSNLMPVGMVSIGSAKAGYQTKFPWSWLCADYSADGNPWLPALKCVSDFMRVGDYFRISFWNSHRGEGQGQVSPRRSSHHFDAAIGLAKVCSGSSVLSCGKTQTFWPTPIVPSPAPWLGIMSCSIKSGRGERGIS